MKYRTLLGLWGKIAALVLLVAAVGLVEVGGAEAQTAPVSGDNSLYSFLDLNSSTTCGVTKAGYIRCWGNVLGAPIYSETDGYAQVATARQNYPFTCGRKTDGTVKCWAGLNLDWYFPAQPEFDPDGTPDSGDERPYTYSDIQAGDQHICGITDGRNGQTADKLVCWSIPSRSPNAFLDMVTTIPDGSATLTAVPAAKGGDENLAALTFSHLGTGGRNNCALVKSGSDAGKPKCWGDTLGTTEPDVPLSALAVSTPPTRKDVACGIVKEATTVGSKSYAVGDIICWGSDEANIISGVPTTGTYTSLDVASHHACAVATGGSITCWGNGSRTRDAGNNWLNYGQLTTPAALASATFSNVYAGDAHTCGLLDGQGVQTAGTLHCWGEQNYAAVHPNDPSWHPWGNTAPYDGRPAGLPPLATGPDAMDVNRYFSCALTAAGNAACWGGADYGYPPPQSVKGLAAALQSACFIRKGGDDDGKVVCVGRNHLGQTSGTSTDGAAMTADLGTLRFSRIYAGVWHYCGIIDDRDKSDGDDSGKVRCWGNNDSGQSVGAGQTDAKNSGSLSRTITDLGTNTYTKITAGYRYTCGLLTNGRIVCWGANVKSGTDTYSTAHQVPAALQSKTFSDIDAGLLHQTCAIEKQGTGQTAGKLHCWGNNPEIGDVTYPLGSVPASLRNLTFTKVSAGHSHNCAITTAGRVKCWGYSGEGRTSVPANLWTSRIVDIDAGSYHTCGVTDRGRAVCWGADGDPNTAGVQAATTSGLVVNFGQADPPPPATGPATGKPTIEGTAQVGKTLTARTTGIGDPDGITRAVFRYQWILVRGEREDALAGEENSTYTITDFGMGHKMRVRVSFYDDRDNWEAVSSDPTATIAAAPATAPTLTMPQPTYTPLFPENATGTVYTYQATDSDGDAITYSIHGGNDGAKFSIGSATGQLTFKAAPDRENPTDANTDNQYDVIVRATSGSGAGLETFDRHSRVTVTDKDESGPVFSTGTSFSVAENRTEVATVEAADADDLDVVKSYTISGGADGSKFSIDNDGVLTFAAAPDFENPTDADGDNEYVVMVRATSDFTDEPTFTPLNGETGSRVRTTDQTITVTVTDVVEGVDGDAEATTAPDPVAEVRVVHDGRSLTVSWDAPARATHYDVTYYGGGVNARAAWNRAGNDTLTITCDIRPEHQGQNCVSPGTAYTVGIRARNSAGESAWTNSTYTPLPSSPDAVTNIQVVHNGSSLTVSWDAPDGATSYDVTYFNTVTGVNARAAWNRAGTSLTITCDSRPDHQGQNCVNSAGTYTVGVRALNAGGESAWRNSAPASYSEGG